MPFLCTAALDRPGLQRVHGGCNIHGITLSAFGQFYTLTQTTFLRSFKAIYDSYEQEQVLPMGPRADVLISIYSSRRLPLPIGRRCSFSAHVSTPQIAPSMYSLPILFSAYIQAHTASAHKLISQETLRSAGSWSQVSLPVVRRFMAKVEEKALGAQVLKGIQPDQQLVKVVNDQLIDLMGSTQEGLVEVKPGQMQARPSARLPDQSHGCSFSPTLLPPERLFCNQ